MFILPIIVDIHGHIFKIYTLVSEIHENVDLVLRIRLQDCHFNFLNRSLPIFPKEYIVLKPKEQKLIKVEAPFIDEISGLAIVNVLYKNTQSTVMLKLKFIQNLATLDITNNG